MKVEQRCFSPAGEWEAIRGEDLGEAAEWVLVFGSREHISNPHIYFVSHFVRVTFYDVAKLVTDFRPAVVACDYLETISKHKRDFEIVSYTYSPLSH